MVGLYSPVILGQHGTAAANVPNILNEGFRPGNISWADFFKGGGRKVFTSTSPNLISQYGDDAIDVVTSTKNLRSPFGGGFTSKSIGFGDEIASTIPQANKGMRLARRVRGGMYPNSQLAQRLLQTGTTARNLSPSLLSKFLPWAGQALRTVGSAPAAGIMTLFNPSSGAGQQELQWEEENQKRMAEAAAKSSASESSQQQERPRRQQGTQKQEQQRKQRTRSRAAQRSQPSKRQQRTRSRGAQRQSRKRTFKRRNYADGGIVSLDYLTRRL